MGRTIYIQKGASAEKGDKLIGVLDTPLLAKYAVDAVNLSKRRDLDMQRAMYLISDALYLAEHEKDDWDQWIKNARTFLKGDG